MGCGCSSSEAENTTPTATKPDKSTADKPPSATSEKRDVIDHACFILDQRGDINNFYSMAKKKLGEGSYGSVCRATNIKTGVVRAVKTISKAVMRNVDRFKQEIAIMKLMDHPNIIKLFETFEDKRNIYLVMEICSGGELFDKIIQTGHFHEVHAAIVMQQIVRAIFYMHEKHVCHRDLKPENFLFMDKEPIERNLIKIIDFGLSIQFTAGQFLKTKAGTPYYVAPQVLAGKYDQLSDLWSCGVILYVMMCGYPPFCGETNQEILAKVKLGNFSFNIADWKSVSDDAKDLIRNLLKMNTKERFSAEQTLNHRWILHKAPKATNVELESSFVDNLQKFRAQNKLKKAALHVIAGQLGSEQIKKLRETFMALDTNMDGLLTSAEMKHGLEQAGLKDIPPDLQEILRDVDADGSGLIDYTEFLAASIDQRLYVEEQVCWQAFNVFDKDDDGKISQDELKAVLESDEDLGGVAGGATAIAKIIEDIDNNKDGMVDFEEFMSMMRKHQ